MLQNLLIGLGASLVLAGCRGTRDATLGRETRDGELQFLLRGSYYPKGLVERTSVQGFEEVRIQVLKLRHSHSSGVRSVTRGRKNISPKITQNNSPNHKFVYASEGCVFELRWVQGAERFAFPRLSVDGFPFFGFPFHPPI
jgi:hypothetical protein